MRTRLTRAVAAYRARHYFWSNIPAWMCSAVVYSCPKMKMTQSLALSCFLNTLHYSSGTCCSIVRLRTRASWLGARCDTLVRLGSTRACLAFMPDMECFFLNRPLLLDIRWRHCVKTTACGWQCCTRRAAPCSVALLTLACRWSRYTSMVSGKCA